MKPWLMSAEKRNISTIIITDTVHDMIFRYLATDRLINGMTTFMIKYIAPMVSGLEKFLYKPARQTGYEIIGSKQREIKSILADVDI